MTRPSKALPALDSDEPRRGRFGKTLVTIVTGILLVIAVRVGVKLWANGGIGKLDLGVAGLGGRKSDADADRLLTGAWRFSTTQNLGGQVALVEGTVAFMPDHTFSIVATGTSNAQKQAINMGGAWRIDKGKVVLKQQWADPPAPNPLEEDVSDILEITETALKAKEADGTVVAYKRVGTSPGDPKTPKAALDQERFVGRWHQVGSASFVKCEFARDGALYMEDAFQKGAGKWWALDDGRIRMEIPNAFANVQLFGFAGLFGPPQGTLSPSYAFADLNHLSLTFMPNMTAQYERLP